jgi:hypothetical protein
LLYLSHTSNFYWCNFNRIHNNTCKGPWPKFKCKDWYLKKIVRMKTIKIYFIGGVPQERYFFLNVFLTDVGWMWMKMNI